MELIHGHWIQNYGGTLTWMTDEESAVVNKETFDNDGEIDMLELDILESESEAYESETMETGNVIAIISEEI